MEDIWRLCDIVRETSYALHTYLRYGFSEKVYENALVNRLRKRQIAVSQQHPIHVYDEDGAVIGEYFADLLVASCLVVEIKAARGLSSEHEAQLLGYLRGTRLEHGMLVNFGTSRMQVRKFIHSGGGGKTIPI